MVDKFKKYKKAFNTTELFERMPKYIKALGLKTIYTVLLLFYAYKRSETPTWAKNIIIGALGYLLAPIDAIPDITPVIGLTDDIGVLSFGLVTIACYINKEIREKARTQLTSWFGNYDNEALEAVDSKL